MDVNLWDIPERNPVQKAGEIIEVSLADFQAMITRG